MKWLTRRNLTNVVFAAAAVAVIGLAACMNEDQQRAVQAQVDASKARLADMDAKIEATRVAAQQAFDRAIAVNDQVAAQQAQKLLDDAKKDAEVVAKAKAVLSTAEAGIAASKGDAPGVVEKVTGVITSFGGTVPPPWGTAITLGGLLVTAIRNYNKSQQATADGAAALAAQAEILAHANSTGATPSAITRHIESVKTNLSEGAAAIYDAAPVIPVKVGDEVVHV